MLLLKRGVNQEPCCSERDCFRTPQRDEMGNINNNILSHSSRSLGDADATTRKKERGIGSTESSTGVVRDRVSPSSERTGLSLRWPSFQSVHTAAGPDDGNR